METTYHMPSVEEMAKAGIDLELMSATTALMYKGELSHELCATIFNAWLSHKDMVTKYPYKS